MSPRRPRRERAAPRRAAGEGVAWVDGAPRRDAAVPIGERAFRYGDGAFVTLRCRRGWLLDGAEHARRLEAACRALGLEPPPEVTLDVLLGALRRLGAHRRSAAVVRVQASAGPSARGYARQPGSRSWGLVELFPPPAPRRLRVVTPPPGLRLPPPAVPGVKSCSALPAVLAARAAEALGAHEILRLERGALAEAAAANLFWIRDGQLRTPAASLPLYPGVTRARVLEAAARLGLPAAEGRFPPAELAGAEAAFLTNATRGVERIHRLDGRPLGWPAAARALAREVTRLRRERAVAIAPAG